ncbi:MAG: UbiA prenyltransferase family protein [Candidatus Woesearchaeota archaeon]
MNKIIIRTSEYIKLIRPWQWYKNLVIFLAIFFVGEFFHLLLLEKVLLGFIALSLISSANYVMNDIIDKKKDKMHPEKKNRPLVSGKITLIEAWIIFIIIILSGLVLAYKLGTPFFISSLGLFIVTLLYSLFLKNEPIVDILLISINFVIRAISGTFIIKVFISPWLILCPFFLALFLAAGKRDSDIRFLKNKDTMEKYKKVLKYYNKEIIDGILIISATSIITAYSLYALSKNTLLLITVPVIIYLILRYYFLINSGSEIARHPERVITDWRMVIAFLIYIILIFIIFYFIETQFLSELIK